MLGSDFMWPLRGATVIDFEFADPDARIEDSVIQSITQPVCFGYAPQRPGGAAVLVLAGGGYTKLVIGKEGVEIARWLTRLGFHAFVLAHRLPHAACGAQAPLDDAMEAMRVIRANADALGVTRVGVLGLSSGGHLAASLAAEYPRAWQAARSAHGLFASRPDFLIVGYAPISTNAAGRTIEANKPPLSPPEKQALYDALQPDAQLAPNPPPAFLFYAANDAVVPVENARRLHDAYAVRGGQAELHIFADAPHGFALRSPDLPAGKWPLLCEAWLRQIGAL
jgi:acetyl esterase/lipase